MTIKPISKRTVSPDTVDVHKSETLTPLRVRPRQAAVLLGMEWNTVRKLILADVFTAIRPDGSGRGKKVYLLYAEVQAFATGGREAVAKMRAQKAR